MMLPTQQIVMLTSEQLEQLAERIVRETISAIQAPKEESTTEYCYGLRGIAELFGVSHVTAQQYKNTFLQPAISQRGRKIMVDVALARQLYAQNKQQ